MKLTEMSRRTLLRGVGRSVVLLPAAALLGCTSRPKCDDVSGLSPEDAKARTDQAYLEAGADRTRLCDLCQQWEAGAEGACGTCKVIKGPINPKGTCNLFVKKT
jgi:hypothetical protein